MTTWGMRIACWIPNGTNTHSEYVILIAFPQQHWLHERALILRDTYIACLFLYSSDGLFSVRYALKSIVD